MTSAAMFGSSIDPVRRGPGRPRITSVKKHRDKHIACAKMHLVRGWKIQTVANQVRASVRSVKTWIKLALSYPECADLAHFARPRRRAS